MTKKQKYTFEQWCLDNNKRDLLNRWDYKLTGFGPGDITYASAKPVYFKCPKGIHDSELRYVYRLTSKHDQNNFVCKQCLAGHAPTFKDITGNIFGELTVLYLDKERSEQSGDTYWICRCSCGEIKSVAVTALNGGRTVTCGNRKIHRSGSNNSNWKGGITPKLLSERTSAEYNNWRDSVYAKCWYTCQCCGRSHGIEKNAHHILNFSENDELKYDINNGICLCSDCHHIKSSGSFHNVYGTRNNTPQQLEEYINNKRKLLGIEILFSLDAYLSGDIFKPDNIKQLNTVKDIECD